MIRWAVARKGKQLMVTKFYWENIMDSCYLEDREGRRSG
jgi:hypothetical protein